MGGGVASLALSGMVVLGLPPNPGALCPMPPSSKKKKPPLPPYLSSGEILSLVPTPIRRPQSVFFNFNHPVPLLSIQHETHYRASATKKSGASDDRKVSHSSRH